MQWYEAREGYWIWQLEVCAWRVENPQILGRLQLLLGELLKVWYRGKCYKICTCTSISGHCVMPAAAQWGQKLMLKAHLNLSKDIRCKEVVTQVVYWVNQKFKFDMVVVILAPTWCQSPLEWDGLLVMNKHWIVMY